MTRDRSKIISARRTLNKDDGLSHARESTLRSLLTDEDQKRIDQRFEDISNRRSCMRYLIRFRRQFSYIAWDVEDASIAVELDNNDRNVHRERAISRKENEPVPLTDEDYAEMRGELTRLVKDRTTVENGTGIVILGSFVPTFLESQ
jgi:hypothetical protein